MDRPGCDVKWVWTKESIPPGVSAFSGFQNFPMGVSPTCSPLFSYNCGKVLRETNQPTLFLEMNQKDQITGKMEKARPSGAPGALGPFCGLHPVPSGRAPRKFHLSEETQAYTGLGSGTWIWIWHLLLTHLVFVGKPCCPQDLGSLNYKMEVHFHWCFPKLCSAEL